MKISNSKKELARIISENGGWRDGSEFAAQDSNKNTYGARVCFYHSKPYVNGSEWIDGSNGLACNAGECIDGLMAINNWHQTILSREEYLHLYPAPHADGWIEWKGGECPVEVGALIDVKYRDLHVQLGSKVGDRSAVEMYATTHWRNSGGAADIIAYRLHKPEQAQPEFCESVMRAIPEPTAKPTIEQLATDYRNAKDYAERKQQEADDAKGDAEAKLAELVAASGALGLVLSVASPEPELVITDWLDLQVGDEIATNSMSKLLIVTSLRCHGDSWPIDAIDGDGITWSVSLNDWRFIRRP